MEKTLTFGEYSIKKNFFHKNKNPININKVDTEKIQLSNKISYGKQVAYEYYVGYVYIYIYIYIYITQKI